MMKKLKLISAIVLFSFLSLKRYWHPKMVKARRLLFYRVQGSLGLLQLSLQKSLSYRSPPRVSQPGKADKLPLIKN